MSGDGVKRTFHRALRQSGGWLSWEFGQGYLQNEMFEPNQGRPFDAGKSEPWRALLKVIERALVGGH
jgi:hypothetical protein